MKILSIISLFFLFGCSNNGEVKHEDDLAMKSNKANQDSLTEAAEDAADKMREEQETLEDKSEKIPSEIVSQDLGWEATKNLEAVRKLSIVNNSEKKIIGVFLKSEVKSGNESTATYDYGKFKFKNPISAHGTKLLRIPAERIGRDSETVLNSDVPSWAGLVMKETLMVKTVIFEDGSFSSQSISSK